MRKLADLQRDPSADEPVQPAPLPLIDGQQPRLHCGDTPEFAGMEFLEVDAKTALNRVKGMPFEWSLNPYRGCSHACAYCLGGDTPILMADGRTKRIADVRPSDTVYGTVREGRYRRYTATPVLDHWQTRKPAYRVVLADGTELIASADHRFLTERGWKHVTGAGCGSAHRAHLTANNHLLGTGAFPDGPKGTDEYRRGYLSGMIRGDGHLRSYDYERAGRAHGNVHRFRLALADEEGLARTASFLRAFGIETSSFELAAERPSRRAMRAIRNYSQSGVEAIRCLIAWPDDPPEEWARGLLAGMFDAEGSYHRGILRIHNGDAAVIDHLRAALRRFGMPHVEEPATSDGCRSIRLTGGLRQHLRFLVLTDPAITRKRTIDGQALKSDTPLGVVSVEPLGLELPMYDITTGTGDFIANGVVSHNCFARPTHQYLNLSPLGDFERKVIVKTNVVEVLRRELAKPSWKGAHVAMGTNTDNYQRCEGRYRLMPGIIDALAEAYTPFSILTKGTLILRDLDRLVAARQRVDVSASFTVGMLDTAVWRDAEPGTPSPRARIDAVAKLNAAGIPTGVMLAPIMPGLNDGAEQISAVVDAAVRARAAQIHPIVLHLRPGVREVFWPWLEQSHPELVGRYAELYRKSQAPKEYRDEISAIVRRAKEAAWRRHGRPERPAPWRRAGAAEPQSPDAAGNPAAAGMQLRLDL